MEELLGTGAFGALVYTDLPKAGRLPGGLQELSGWGLPTVSTTAACRWGLTPMITDLKERLRQRMLAGDRALVLLTGDNVRWRNPNPKHGEWPLDALGLLADFHEVRDELALEDPPAAWCVANPLAEDVAGEVARLGAKAAAGAEVVITQPAGLLPGRALRFWEEMERAGVSIPVVAGVAVPATVGALERHLSNCEAVSIGYREDYRLLPRGGEASGPAPDVDQLLQSWREAEAAGVRSFAEWRVGALWEAVAFSRALPRVVGVHMIPVDMAGVADLAALLARRRQESPGEPPL